MNQNKHGGNISYYAKTYDIPQNLIVDFSSNINPIGPKESTLRLISENIFQIKNYPEPDSLTATKAAAQALQIPEEQLIFGNGATELLFLLMHKIKPNMVCLPYPTFSEYEAAAKAVGSAVSYFPLTDDFQSFNPEVTEGLSEGSLIVICNPNNPTGTLFGKEELLTLAEKAREKKAYCLIDESFVDFLEDPVSLRQEVANNPYLIILYSLTKIFAIPGLRLGTMIADPELIAGLHSLKDPWNVNILAQAICEDLFADRDFLIMTKSKVYKERSKMTDRLKRIPQLKVYPASANYIFLEILSGQTAAQLQDYLIQKRIMIRDCSNYRGLSESFFRIAVKDTEENDTLLALLSEFFAPAETETHQ